MKNIFLSGPPGIGKTTIIKKVVAAAPNLFGGFYTEEMRKKTKRVGFRIRTLKGREGILAHVDLESPYRVGKYRVKLEDLEKIGLRSIQAAVADKRMVAIDELGKMELFSEKFKEEVVRALDSPRRVLATVKEGKNAFLDNIKSREDVLLIEVTRENRDRLPREIKRLLNICVHQ